MTGNLIEKGKTIYEVDEPLNALHMISEGRVIARYPGGEYYLSKGDIIGICEVAYDVHFISYEAAEDTNLATYPCPTPSVLDEIITKYPDVARLFLLSAFSQINTLLEHCSISGLNCSSLYQNLSDDYNRYVEICSHYKIAPQIPDGYEDLTAYLGEESPDYWLASYYLGMSHLLSGELYTEIISDPAVPIGLIKKCCLDFHKVYLALEEQYRYLKLINSFYFNELNSDLFEFYSNLYYKLGSNSPDSDELFADINQFILLYGSENETDMDAELLQKRISTFQENIATMQIPGVTKEIDEEVQLPDELKDSLNTILEYSEVNDDIAAAFRGLTLEYKHLKDKFATDEDSIKLRAGLTKTFNAIYSTVIRKAITAKEIPTAVKMFLYFGFVDEELAGSLNTNKLLELLDELDEGPKNGVYTLFHWMKAIYAGEKEPSRNEFDQDYTDFLHKQRATGEITDKDFKLLENDNKAKLNYELSNMFLSANKITYGRISVYCPIFIEENIFKDLWNSFTSPDKIHDAINNVRRTDFSAYFRESMDNTPNTPLGKELVHFEFLPDVILMPNVGIRGSMWQEIEGKRRTTPGRIFLSIFHLEDLKLTMVRLSGEFRWEMCKRIQGSRWNMISDKSLTSEYFDYVQFYRKNRDLSNEAKEKIRASLQRSKNSYKEMFVRDYIEWIMFEGGGSPRLNKVAREIMFNYCPFSKEICDKLKTNPLYSDLINRRNIQSAQKLHRVSVLIQKIEASGRGIPTVLREEVNYIQGIPNI